MALASRRVRQYELDPEELQKQIDATFADISAEELEISLNESITDVRPGQIVMAKVDTVDERTGLVIMDALSLGVPKLVSTNLLNLFFSSPVIFSVILMSSKRLIISRDL